MKNADQPAFPSWEKTEDEKPIFYHGISRREYFAALAMQGILSNPEAMEYITKQHDSDLHSAFDRMVERSVELADHLLKQLES